MTDPSRAPGARAIAPAQPVTILYTNWRGETAERRIMPMNAWFGTTPWHPEPQWFIRATDMEKGVQRDFALRDMGPAKKPEPSTVRERLELVMMDAEAVNVRLRHVLAEGWAEMDRLHLIRATIITNALRNGATRAEAEAFANGKEDFITWMADRINAGAVAPEPVSSKGTQGAASASGEE